MATAQTLIDQVRTGLLAGTSERRNKVGTGGYTAGSGTITFANDLTGIGPGTILSIGTNTLFVWSVNAAGNTATVSGGEAGSTDANATAGTIVRVSPRFADHEILNAINAELDSLSSPDAGLFQVATAELAYTGGVEGYTFTPGSGFLDIWQVQWRHVGPGVSWRRLADHQWWLQTDAETDDFASGYGLRIDVELESQVRVVYRRGFTVFAAVTDNVTTTGLPTTAYDVPVLGAQVRLLSLREAKRAFTEAQGDPRRSDEVPPGSAIRSLQPLVLLYNRRVGEERDRLRRRYPLTKW